MLVAKGILTQRGGATSHAAVVARGLGLPCVAGCEAIRVDAEKKLFVADGKTIKEGDFISIDGTTGEVFAGQIATIRPDFDKEVDLVTLLSWADEVRRLGVWANADYPRDAIQARKFGAQGIGLCRTEHMFFEVERLPVVRQMILNASAAQQKLDARQARRGRTGQAPRGEGRQGSRGCREEGREGVAGSEGIRRRVEEVAALAAQGL